MSSIIINCDSLPSSPPDMRVADHFRRGLVLWDKERYSGVGCLYQSQEQKDGGLITGRGLFEALQTAKVIERAANACVLDRLLAHRGEIPESWERYGAVFFPMTIYIRPQFGQFIRGLFREQCGWQDGYRNVKDDFGEKNVVLLDLGLAPN